MDYHSVYKSWQADPESFWMEAAENIDWEQKPTFALNDSSLISTTIVYMSIYGVEACIYITIGIPLK